MAKEKYTITNIVDIVGQLDINDHNDLTIYVTEGSGDKAVTREIDVVPILNACVGRQIALKLTDEEDGYNE